MTTKAFVAKHIVLKFNFAFGYRQLPDAERAVEVQMWFDVLKDFLEEDIINISDYFIRNSTSRPILSEVLRELKRIAADRESAKEKEKERILDNEREIERIKKREESLLKIKECLSSGICNVYENEDIIKNQTHCHICKNYSFSKHFDKFNKKNS